MPESPLHHICSNGELKMMGIEILMSDEGHISQLKDTLVR